MIFFVLFAVIAVAMPFAESYENVALNKPVSGRNILTDGENTWAYLTDGDPNTCVDSGKLVDKPTFVVDLGQEHFVIGFKLVFASDCSSTISGTGCGYKNTVIKVGDGLDTSQLQDCRVIDLKKDKAKGEKSWECDSPGPVIGTHVSLTKRNANKRAIALCELEVIGEPVVNIALNKPVSGKRLLADGQATWPYLVDGDPTTCADSGTKVYHPAFKVDLGEDYIVRAVKLVFAQGCSNTIDGIGCSYADSLIEVGEGQDWRVDEDCITLNRKKDKAKGVLTRVCSSGPVTGRFVTLLKLQEKDRAIHLCELRVYGSPVNPPPPTEAPTPPPPPPPKTEAPGVQTTFIPTLPPCDYPAGLSNVARDKTATQSSDKPRKDSVAANAVDGDKNSDATSGACSWTNKEFQPWWKVDLGKSYDVHYLSITNRQDCCPFRIKNAEIRVGDSENFQDNPVCGGLILGRMAKQQPIHIRCGCDIPMRGRYVSIQLIDREQQLHMCEVEVMAK